MFKPNLEIPNFSTDATIFLSSRHPRSIEVRKSFNNLKRLYCKLIKEGKLKLLPNNKSINHPDLFLNIKERNSNLVFYYAKSKGNNVASFEVDNAYEVLQLNLFVNFIRQVNGYVVEEQFDMNMLDVEAMIGMLNRIEQVMSDPDAVFDNSEYYEKSTDGEEDEIIESLYKVNDINVLIFWAVCITLGEEDIEALKKKIEIFSIKWIPYLENRLEKREAIRIENDYLQEVLRIIQES